jgi:hypothetical protein
MARNVPLICPSGKAKYFLFWGLTRFLKTRIDLPRRVVLSHAGREIALAREATQFIQPDGRLISFYL